MAGFCARCGAALGDGARYCPQCGIWTNAVPLQPVAPPVTEPAPTVIAVSSPPSRSVVLIVGCALYAMMGFALLNEAARSYAEIDRVKNTPTPIIGTPVGVVARVLNAIAGRTNIEALRQPQEELQQREMMARYELWGGIALAGLGGVLTMYALAQTGPSRWLSGMVWAPLLLGSTWGTFHYFAPPMVAADYHNTQGTITGRVADVQRDQGFTSPPPVQPPEQRTSPAVVAPPAVFRPAPPPPPTSQPVSAPPISPAVCVQKLLVIRGLPASTCTQTIYANQGNTIDVTVQVERNGVPTDIEVTIVGPQGQLALDTVKPTGTYRWSERAATTGSYTVKAHNPSITQTRTVTITYSVRP